MSKLRLPFEGSFRLSQAFGLNPQLYSKFSVKQPDGSVGPMKGHNGLDFAMPVGTPIYAPHQGQVIEAQLDQTGYGWYVKIENGEEGSVLAHMDRLVTQPGFLHLAGELLGYSGNSGFSTGPHLHWGYFLKPRDRSNGYAGFIDQIPLLEGKTADTSDLTTSTSGNTSEVKVKTQAEYDAAMNDREKFWKERDKAEAEVKKLKEEDAVEDAESEKALKEIRNELETLKQEKKEWEEKDKIRDQQLREQGRQLEEMSKSLQKAIEDKSSLASMIGAQGQEDLAYLEVGIRALEKLKQEKKVLEEEVRNGDSVALLKRAQFVVEWLRSFYLKVREARANRPPQTKTEGPDILKQLGL